jgi:transposase
MSHPNAALTPRHRLIVAQLVVDQGWPISEVAARFQASWPTVKRWADRYRTGQSMQDRTSRPHRSPNKTNHATAKRCIQLRLRLREGQSNSPAGWGSHRPRSTGSWSTRT